ncbi:hypothetical protein J4Q44_G00090440 [Coregonus suidteri]|uniref:Doublecortin domain-containing protein n=1 Tax=Coregonus suidteri TaxID=861788 RepID=A0AAN8M2L6_9TELE
MMDRLLQIIHQRLGSGVVYRPSGPCLVPTGLFDEQGGVVAGLRHLHTDQRLSYGEHYRSPHSAVLSLVLEKALVAVAGDRDYHHAVYRAPLDPDTALPTGFKKWEAVEGFPFDRRPCTTTETMDLKGTVDADAHFKQLMERPEMVLVPSATVVKRTRSASVQGPESSMGWPAAHIWIITKRQGRSRVRPCPSSAWLYPPWQSHWRTRRAPHTQRPTFSTYREGSMVELWKRWQHFSKGIPWVGPNLPAGWGQLCRGDPPRARGRGGGRIGGSRQTPVECQRSVDVMSVTPIMKQSQQNPQPPSRTRARQGPPRQEPTRQGPGPAGREPSWRWPC